MHGQEGRGSAGRETKRTHEHVFSMDDSGGPLYQLGPATAAWHDHHHHHRCHTGLTVLHEVRQLHPGLRRELGGGAWHT